MDELPSYAIALREALAIIKRVCSPEVVPLENALNRVLAEDILADRDIPPYNRSQMDGYAVKSSDITKGVSLRVIGGVAAGTFFHGVYEQGTCVSIATGAPVPDGFDAVIPHEKTDSGAINVVINCEAPIVGSCVHSRGVDAKQDAVLVEQGTQMKPQHIGLAASIGKSKLEVMRRPKVILFTSGDEIVASTDTPLPHQIRNSNCAMIRTAFELMGCEVIESKHIEDNEDETIACVSKALDGQVDLLVTVGGISAGERDFFPVAFDSAKVSYAVRGARIQPGKPIIIGRNEHSVVLGLPGNPVSAMVCSCIFGWAIIRELQGNTIPLPWQIAPLAENVKPNQYRSAFRPCVFMDGEIHIPAWQGSGDLTHTACTNGLVQLPEHNGVLEAGAPVSYMAYPWI